MDEHEKNDLLKIVALLMMRQNISTIGFTTEDLKQLRAEHPDLAIVIAGGGDSISVSLEDRTRTLFNSLEFH